MPEPAPFADLPGRSGCHPARRKRDRRHAASHSGPAVLWAAPTIRRAPIKSRALPKVPESRTDDPGRDPRTRASNRRAKKAPALGQWGFASRGLQLPLGQGVGRTRQAARRSQVFQFAPGLSDGLPLSRPCFFSRQSGKPVQLIGQAGEGPCDVLQTELFVLRKGRMIEHRPCIHLRAFDIGRRPTCCFPGLHGMKPSNSPPVRIVPNAGRIASLILKERVRLPRFESDSQKMRPTLVEPSPGAEWPQWIADALAHKPESQTLDSPGKNDRIRINERRNLLILSRVSKT